MPWQRRPTPWSWTCSAKCIPAKNLDRVLDLDCDAVGVNNRDLSTFAVRLQVSLDLASRLPSGAVHVSESGIETAEDLNRLRAAGFHAFLIGESLMRQQNPGAALETLLVAAAELLASEQVRTSHVDQDLRQHQS